MRYYSYFILLSLFFIAACNNTRREPEHYGRKTAEWYIKLLDSIEIKDDSVSWNGSYFSSSGILGFLDGETSSLSFYDWDNGELLFRDLDKGHARNELPGWSVATAIDSSDSIVIYADNFLYFYDVSQRKLISEGFVNFGYTQNDKEKDFESSRSYKLCSINIYPIDSETLLFPLAYNSENIEGWYENSHIWGLYNYKERKFTKLSGHIPSYYKQHPVPLFERFVSYKVGSGYVTTHVLDSLLYFYTDIDNISHSFGYEIGNANRKYTCKENDMYDAMTAVKDENKISLNQSLYYSKNMNVLIRTVVTNKGEGCITTIQVYNLENYDLTTEYQYHGQIDIMYSNKNILYGVNLNPDDKNYIYRFAVNKR